MKIYNEIVRNTEMGIQAIDDLINVTESERLRADMLNQKEVMEDFRSRAAEELSSEECSAAEGTKMQQTMVRMGTKMNSMFDKSESHLASMLTDGYNMGLTSVQKCINEMKNDGLDVPEIACDLMKAYDKCIKELRVYL